MGSIRREDWDMGKGLPRQGSDDLIKLSLYLDAIKAKLFNIYQDLKLRDELVTAGSIKNIYLGKGNRNYTVLQLTDQAIEKYKVELAPGSLKKL
jgi:integrase/recombinase XerD